MSMKCRCCEGVKQKQKNKSSRLLKSGRKAVKHASAQYQSFYQIKNFNSSGEKFNCERMVPLGVYIGASFQNKIQLAVAHCFVQFFLLSLFFAAFEFRQSVHRTAGRCFNHRLREHNQEASKASKVPFHPIFVLSRTGDDCTP